jgi:cobalt-zinc-cadmium efflux system membrane fusion protein
VNVNIGKYVNPSDVLFEFINPDDIHLNLKVYEKDLENLKRTTFCGIYQCRSCKKYYGEIILSKDINQEVWQKFIAILINMITAWFRECI